MVSATPVNCWVNHSSRMLIIGPRATDLISEAVVVMTSEPKSHYEIWWTFGWPYETSVAMAHLVFAGIFDKYPNLPGAICDL